MCGVKGSPCIGASFEFTVLLPHLGSQVLRLQLHTTMTGTQSHLPHDTCIHMHAHTYAHVHARTHQSQAHLPRLSLNRRSSQPLPPVAVIQGRAPHWFGRTIFERPLGFCLNGQWIQIQMTPLKDQIIHFWHTPHTPFLGWGLQFITGD